MPRHSSDTQRHALAGGPSVARDKIWRAMRMLRQFKIAQLLEICSVPRKTAEKYLRALVRAEYLRVAKPSRGKTGNVYTLIKNTGPFAPRAGRTGVSLDPNLEIERLREERRAAIAGLARLEEQLERLGAFVEKSNVGRAGA